jgi:flagellar M-ring protein FliF
MLQQVVTFWTQFRSQALVFYQGLTRGRRIALAGGLLAVIVLIIGAIMWQPGHSLTPAYTNLSDEDQMQILALMKKNNVKDFKLEGGTLSVPSGQMLDYRMMLAQEGLPNSGSGVGWEKFDEQSFGKTDFDQRINKLRALQGELARSISKLDPVDAARVHIVMPTESVFAEDRKPTTASISLRLKPGKQMSQRQIQGVLHLVARAVEGLDPSHIAIVDQEGNMLTQSEDKTGGIDTVTSTQRSYQKRIETEMEAKITEILSRLVGQNKVVAKVQADIDFTQVEKTIEDFDPDRTAVRSSERTEQSSNGTGLNPTGVPGAKSNLPGEAESTSAAANSNTSNQSTEQLNYEVKKTVSRIVEPIGQPKKISVAVLVDGKHQGGAYAERSAEDLATITKLVKNSIGLVEGRDAITVENARFEMDQYEMAEQATMMQQQTSLIKTGIFAAVAIIGMVFLYIALLKPYFRWLTFDPEKRGEEEFSLVDYELERSGSTAKRVQVQEEVPFDKLSPKEQVMYLAKHDPEKTAEALRQFLSPNH